MNEVLLETSRAAMSLPPQERAALAHALIKSLDTEVGSSVDEAWDEELALRIARFELGQSSSRDAFEVLSKLKSSNV